MVYVVRTELRLRVEMIKACTDKDKDKKNLDYAFKEEQGQSCKHLDKDCKG